MSNPSERVHYCPGDAVGSPATMRRDEAERYLWSDRKYVEIMATVLPGHYSVYPHLGYDVCRKCSNG